jgi:3-oxoacyl-[acyl-carrier-protein] synthase III
MNYRMRLVALAALVIGSMVLATACSDDDSTTGSTGVEFGSGSLPSTVPEGFPIPEGAVISSTLVDWDRNNTEVVFRIAAEPAAVILFYDQNLERAGYVVSSSDGDATMRVITFNGNGIAGELDIDPEGQQATRVVLAFSTE